MHLPIHDVVDVFPVSFSSSLTVDVEPEPDVSPHILSSYAKNGLICIGVGKCLTIVDGREGPVRLEDIVDIEFEHDIASITWDPEGSCLLVADKSGLLHFVTPTSGTILFSHRVIPGNACETVHIENILLISSVIKDECVPILVCCLSNGVLIHILGIPFSTIRDGEPHLQTVLKNLKIIKYDTSFQGALKWLYIASPSTSLDNSSCQVLVIESSGHLHVLQLGLDENFSENNGGCNFRSLEVKYSACVDEEDDVSYVDMSLVHCSIANFVLLLSSSGSLSILRVDKLEIVEVYSLPGYSFGQILSMNVYSKQPHSALASLTADSVVAVYLNVKLCGSLILHPTYCSFLITLNSSERSPKPCAMLLDQGMMINICDDGSSPLCESVYSIADNGGGCGSRMIRWKNATEISIISCNDSLCYPVTMYLNGHCEMSRCIMNSELSETEAPLECKTDCYSLLGYMSALYGNIHFPESFAYPLNSIHKDIVGWSSVPKVMAIVRLGMLSCPPGVYISLLRSAKELVYRLQFDNATPCIDEIAMYEGCVTTSSLHVWGREESIADNLPPCFHNKLISLLPCNAQETWMRCIREGMLKVSSVILHKHMDGQIPPSLLTCKNSSSAGAYKLQVIHLLPLEDENGYLSPSLCIQDIVDWICGDILPLVLGKNCRDGMISTVNDRGWAIIDLCSLFMDLARKSELRDGHPFDSLSAAEMAVTLLSSTIISDECNIAVTKLMEEARSLQHSLRLQTAIIQNWNQKITLIEIADSGLSGALSILLIALAEMKLAENISKIVRPLMEQFGENLDIMLYEWIHKTIHSTILSEDEDNSNSEVEGESKVHYSRLVIVASSIDQPEIRAKSILLLLQILPVKLEACEANDDSGLNAINTLREMVDGISSMLTADTRDALTEALRARQLRQLAHKYGIEGFDPRKHFHTMAISNVIIRRSLCHQSIVDALTFVDACGSSHIDKCGILTKAMLYRIIPFHFSNDSVESFCANDSFFCDTSFLQSAFDCIPSDVAAIVLEDTCSFLLDLVDDIFSSCNESDAAESGHNRQLFAASIAGAIAISSTFLDLKGDRAHTQNSTNDYNNISINSVKFQRTDAESYISTDLYMSLKRIRNLSSEFRIYLSLQELFDESTCRELVRKKAESAADDLLNYYSQGSYSEGEQPPAPIPSMLRRMCSLLNISQAYACQRMIKHVLNRKNMLLSMMIADHIGTDGMDTTAAVDDCNGLLDVIVSLCSLAAKKAQESNGASAFMDAHLDVGSGRSRNKATAIYDSPVAPFALCATLLRIFLLSCPAEHLGRSIDMLNSCELVLSVHQRFEGDSGVNPLLFSSFRPFNFCDHLPSNSPTVCGGGASGTNNNIHVSQAVHTLPHGKRGTENNTPFKINASAFVRDGILMSPSQVWGPLLSFLMEEVKRRQMRLSSSLDIDKLVNILQRTENNMLAIRILLTSWSSYSTKNKSLLSSVLALSRKVLLSQHIDTSLAVALLATVPYDMMVKELRAAIPSIQSDFSRLQTVARVGENLAKMWEQEELLSVFQTLQMNAKWWHTLVAHGVKIDPRTFQSSHSAQREAAIRSVVPALLEKSNGNLSLAMDYCSQFELEAYYASLCYIEDTLKKEPCGMQAGSFDWSTQIRATAATVDESMVLSTFRKILPHIHGVDYEKIRFVCTWILEVLSEDEDGSGNSGEDTWKEYQKYLEIATFLSTLSCPTHVEFVLLQLKSIYHKIPTEYLSRIPLWHLISQPWQLIEPFMLHHPEFALKLVPLCHLLNIEKDDFYAKHAMNFYAEKLKSFAASAVTSTISSAEKETLSNSPTKPADILGKDHPINSVQDIIQNIYSVVRRISIWQWIYEFEISKKDDERASYNEDRDLASISALQFALKEIAEAEVGMLDVKTTATVKELKAEILLELVKHNCLCSLRSLECYHSTSYKNRTVEVVADQVGNVDEFLRAIFDIVIEQAWLLQLRSLRNLHDILCIYSLMSHSLTPAVAQYLQVVQQVVRDIFSFHAQLSGQKMDIHADSSASSTTPVKSQLEAIRHSYIGNLLSDVEFGQSGNESEKRALLFQNDASMGMWGAGESGGDLSDVNPSHAELRRREDVLRAFGISVLVACTDVEATRIEYANQLMAVSKGTGSRSQRRLTARSKFRAVQAMRFISSRQFISHNELFRSNDIKSSGLYLFCLSELQELRLPCSEDTLADAIGYNLHIRENDPPADLVPNPSPLVTTWLHDDGNNSDVCELARDVLLASSGILCDGLLQCTGSNQLDSLWNAIVKCMVHNGHIKALLHTLSVCDQMIVPMLQNDALNNEISRILCRIANDAATRIHQVTEIISTRQNSCTDIHVPGDSDCKTAPETENENSTLQSSKVILNTRNVVLLSHIKCAGSDQWETPPEDVGLTALRVARCWRLLGKCHTTFSIDYSLHEQTSAVQGGMSQMILMNSLKDTSLRLISAAQKLGCSVVKTVEDEALRDALAVAAQQCAVACFCVLRSLAETMGISNVISGFSLGDGSRWLGVTSLIGEHMIEFLDCVLKASQGSVATDTTTDNMLMTLLSIRVLESFFSEFPHDVVIYVLNKLCNVTPRQDTADISKILESNQDDNCDENVRIHVIQEIIRCCACSNNAIGKTGGCSILRDKNNIFGVVFDWLSYSEGNLLQDMSTLLSTLAPSLKRSVLATLSHYSKQNSPTDVSEALMAKAQSSFKGY